MNRRLALIAGAALSLFGGYLATRSSSTVDASGSVPSVAGARGRAPKPSAGGTAGPNFAFVDAGIVSAPELDLRVGGAISLKEGTSGQAGALILRAPIGVATTGGSGVGDVNVQGDFYVGNGLPFSVTYSGGNVTAGSMHSTSTKTTACVSMTGGSATATTFSGAVCSCWETTTAILCRPSVSGTILTMTVVAGGSDTVCYHCF